MSSYSSRKKIAGQRGVAGDAAPGLVDRANIAAGAEGALAGAADHDGMDHGFVRPGPQHRGETPVHAEREGIQCLGPVQGTVATPP